MRGRGFTLIEVLVALAVFGVMSALAYSALSQTLRSAEMLNERMDRLQAVQRTIRHLANDLAMAAPRPVRDELGTGYLPAVEISAANEYVLAVTHGGWPNPAGNPRGTLQRSVYMLDEGRLVRVYYPVLDSTFSNNAIATEILDGVLELRFDVVTPSGDIVNEWPAPGSAGPPALLSRPRAVEIILTLEDEGEIRRIVEVAT